MAVSYDSPAILKDFANRHKIEFPLVADPESKIISSFGVFNSQATGMTKGMAHPGFYFIDAAGVIREKYFETNYTDRFTANNVIGKLFPELTEEVRRDVDAPHLKLTLEQSDATATLGSRVTLRESMRYTSSLRESGDHNTVGGCFTSTVPCSIISFSQGRGVA